MIGFKIIKDMTREELIEEVLDHQREQLTTIDDNDLKANVVNLRLMAMKTRLMDEAGLKAGPLGFLTPKEEEE